MKPAIGIFICIVGSLLILHHSGVAQTAEELYQKAVQLEEVKGELDQAIESYKTVVRQYPQNAQLAAQSLLRMGRCYERLGNTEARKAYEKIVSDYASQPEAVAEARIRIAALDAGKKGGGAPVARRLISDNVEPAIKNPRILMPSPDGRWVAYTQGEVCIRNLESGEVRQIAPGEPAMKSFSVVWSTDGKRLAFWQRDLKTKLGSIKIYDLATGETATVLSSGTSQLLLVDWSRDGRYILCNHDRNTLELVTVKDGTMRTLSDSVWQGQRASFSPDGRFVTYASGKHAKESVYTQPVTGGQRHRIASAQKEQSNAYLHPLWSPDGSAIAFQQSDGIWVVPVTNGEASGPARLAFMTDLPRWAVTWTEGGGFYLTYNGENFHAYTVTVDPATGQPANAEPQKIPDAPDDLSDFAWAPDAQHITYTGWGDKIRFYATETKTMTSYDVGNRMTYRPSRAANGQEVFFEVGDPPSQTAYVSVLDVGSGKTRDLFPPIRGFAFSFSMDGKKMAYVRRSASGAEVIVGETGKTDGRVVATGLMAIPELSPKGDQVFLIRKGDASPEYGGTNGFSLWVVAADSSSSRRIASAWGIANAVWDPSGRFIAYLARPDSGAEARDLRIVEAATGTQRGNVLLPVWDRIQLTDWSGDGKSIGFFATKVFWEFWVVENLLAGGRQEGRRGN